MQLHFHPATHPAPQYPAMAATLEVESTLTDRYQTTVPETVRLDAALSVDDE